MANDCSHSTFTLTTHSHGHLSHSSQLEQHLWSQPQPFTQKQRVILLPWWLLQSFLGKSFRGSFLSTGIYVILQSLHTAVATFLDVVWLTQATVWCSCVHSTLHKCSQLLVLDLSVLADSAGLLISRASQFLGNFNLLHSQHVFFLAWCFLATFFSHSNLQGSYRTHSHRKSLYDTEVLHYKV